MTHDEVLRDLEARAQKLADDHEVEQARRLAQARDVKPTLAAIKRLTET